MNVSSIINLRALRLIHRVNLVAPSFAFIVLLTVGTLARCEARLEAVPKERGIEVTAAFNALPYRLGSWIGSDVPLPAGATEILNSSAVVSRRYQELGTGRRATLGIVHCSDIRDMLGHYPPNCYPSSGYTVSEGNGEIVKLAIGSDPIEAVIYRFVRAETDGSQRELTVVGFFVLPEIGTSVDMKLVTAMARSRAVSQRGIGQVQVVLDGVPQTDAAIAIAQALLSRVPASLFTLLGAPHNSFFHELEAASSVELPLGQPTNPSSDSTTHASGVNGEVE